jgi:hypothetical protein
MFEQPQCELIILGTFALLSCAVCFVWLGLSFAGLDYVYFAMRTHMMLWLLQQ